MIFLYPYFLLLLFVPVVLLSVKHLSRKNNSWASICDEHLLPFLTIQTTDKKTTFYKNLMIAIWCLATVCLAGPAILKKDVSTAVVGNGLVVVVDMSPAMDKQASEQMSRKLYDLTSIKDDTSFGLVLADNFAYTALPITQDKSVFQNIIPDLKERIMPSPGQNIKAGIEKAETLLNQSGFKNGQILLITAGVANADELAQAIQNTSHPVHVMGVGNNTSKHPVTLYNGQFWGNQTPVLVGLESLTDILGSQYNYASLDDSDLKSLLKNLSPDKIEKSDHSVEQYQNLGVYGVLLLLPLVALLFRRGVLFLLLFCLMSAPCYAGFWWRTEQELYQKQMQGIADFNVGQYEEAQKNFAKVASDDIDALYNLATAQAYAGKIQDAIATYENVLKKDPNNEDAAYNLKYLKEQLPPPPPPESQQQSSNQQNENDKQEDSENSSGENQQNEQSEQSPASDSNEKQNDSADNQTDSNEQPNDDNEENADQKENPSSDSKENTNQQNKQNDGNDMKEQSATITPSDISEQAPEQQKQPSPAIMPTQDQKQKEWLDQIKPDAGRVLRYRLFKQYQEQQ